MFLVSLAMLLALSVPALAQGADAGTAAGSQYGVDSNALSTGDIPGSFAGHAASGTGAVNEALDGSESSEPDAAPEKVAGLTMLPETGGAPLLALCAGVFLSGAGVLSIIRRTRP